MNAAKDFSDNIPEPMILTIGGKPAIQLPNDGLLLSDFSEELGRLLGKEEVFAREGCAFTLDHRGHKLEPIAPTKLRTLIEKHVVPFKMKDGEGGLRIKVKRSISEDIAKAVTVSPQFLAQLPKVERFNPCPMPVLRSDGSIELLTPGMDLESATFTAAGSLELKLMPLAQACEILKDLLNEFAWAEDSGRSLAVHISAMLTVFASGILPPGTIIPVFLYLGNGEGAGKTLLAVTAGIPYETPPPAEPAPRDESEWQKKLLALTVSGRRLVLLDNLKVHLDSAALEAYVTSTSFSGRILGITKEFTGQAGATILITGNRLTISPDMRRRSLLVELFMSELRAEDRKFRRILDAKTLTELRPSVLSALWSIVKAWDEAGRPSCSHGHASFPRWAQTIAGMVEFAGFGSPLAPAEVDGVGDTDTADFASLVTKMVVGERYTFEAITEKAGEAGLFERVLNDRDKDDNLSRKAKSAFGKLLSRYGGRRVSASGGTFLVEGKGRERRFVLSDHHGRHGCYGVSPLLENATFSRKPVDHDNHDNHDKNQSDATATPAGAVVAKTPHTPRQEARDLEAKWADVLAKVVEAIPLSGHWLSHWEQVTLEGEVLKVVVPARCANLIGTPLALRPAGLIKTLWADLHGHNVEFRPQASNEPAKEPESGPLCIGNVQDFENDQDLDAAVERFGATLIDEGKHQH